MLSSQPAPVRPEDPNDPNDPEADLGITDITT
jgi:hypothetical protein